MSEFSTIGSLRPGLKQVSLKFKVISKSDVREVNSRLDGSLHRVAEAIVGDPSGVVTMTLWDDQIDMIDEDETYVLKNGHTSIFRERLRLNIGRFGSIEKSDEKIEEVNMDNDVSSRTYERRSREYRGRGFTRRGKGRY